MANDEQAPEPNSIEDFYNRAFALADEAKAFGVEVAVVLYQDDRFADEELKMALWTCGPVKAIGFAAYLKFMADRMLKATLDSDGDV